MSWVNQMGEKDTHYNVEAIRRERFFPGAEAVATPLIQSFDEGTLVLRNSARTRIKILVFSLPSENVNNKDKHPNDQTTCRRPPNNWIAK